MKRDAFLKILSLGGAAVLLPLQHTGCRTKELDALRPWDTLTDLSDDTDIRIRLLSYAILAPSAHNKQPWIVDLRNKGIDLYIDPSRLLPQTDPPARQITISQGTFLETLSIAATHFGATASISLFPNGIDPAESIGKNPVAHIDIIETPSGPEETLFSFITVRHTNRRVYTGPPLSDTEISELKKSYADDNYPLRMITTPQDIATLAGMMTEAMRIETYNHDMHGETVSMLRFNDDEVEQHRDGLSFPNLGITGMKRFFAEMFSSRSSAFSESFLQRTVESVKEGAFSSQAIGVLSSRGLTRVDEIMVGRYFSRIFLTTTRLGLSLQPMSQILEIDSVRKKFIDAFGMRDEHPQMIFRLGRSAPTPHSARRMVTDIIKS